MKKITVLLSGEKVFSILPSSPCFFHLCVIFSLVVLSTVLFDDKGYLNRKIEVAKLEGPGKLLRSASCRISKESYLNSFLFLPNSLNIRFVGCKKFKWIRWGRPAKRRGGPNLNKNYSIPTTPAKNSDKEQSQFYLFFWTAFPNTHKPDA